MNNYSLLFDKATQQLVLRINEMDYRLADATSDDVDLWPSDNDNIKLTADYLVIILGRCTLNGQLITATQVAANFADDWQQQLSDLSGRFAILIFQRATAVLYAYADKFGSLALFYQDNQNSYQLSSALHFVRREHPLAKQSLYNYFYFHTIPGPASVWQGVLKLEPASCVALAPNQSPKTEVYWHPTFAKKLRKPKAELAAELRSALKQATASFKDSPEVGCFLSGGLDSSSVVACLAQQSQVPVKTFTIGFSEPGYDETDYAKIIADAFNTEHHVYYVTPEDILQELPRIAAYYQQPFGNSSALPTYFCARLAKQHGVKLMLAGDGGDELFSGNERYAKQMIFERFRQTPLFFRQVLASGVKFTSKLIPISLTRKALSFIEQSELDLASRLQRYNFLHQHAAEQVFTQSFLREVEQCLPLQQIQQRFSAAGAVSPVDAMLFNDWKFTLADNDLVKVNGMTELAGVEVVYPMLDQQVLDLSLQLPPELKLTKHNLRDFYKYALGPVLPSATIAKQKHGFGLPFGKWLAEHKGLQQIAAKQLSSLKQRDIFRSDFIDNAVAQQQTAHAAYYGELIWVMIMLEFWLSSHKVN